MMKDTSHTGGENEKGFSGNKAKHRKPRHLSPLYIRMAAVAIIGECVGGRVMHLRLPLTGKECSGRTGEHPQAGTEHDAGEEFISLDAARILLGEYIETWKRQVASGELTELFEMYGGCGCQLRGATPTSGACASKRRLFLAMLNDPVVHKAVLHLAEILHQILEQQDSVILTRKPIEGLCNDILEFCEEQMQTPAAHEEWVTQMIRMNLEG